MIGTSPDCLKCKHFHKPGPQYGLTCDAFPGGIPEEILMGVKHTEPYSDDNGIRFEPQE